MRTSQDEGSTDHAEPDRSGAVGVIAALPSRDELESIVASAARAPSIYNTQPWRWVSHDDVLDVRADRTRQLHVADRDGHSLLLSCGAALELTELATKAMGWTVETSLMPDDADPDLLARLRFVRRDLPNETAAARLGVALGRRSERRPFDSQPVPPEVVDRLRAAATLAGVSAHFPIHKDEMIDLAVAVSQADRAQNNTAEYAAEAALWVGHDDDDDDDGVPTTSLARPPVGHPRHVEIPLRDYDTGVAGAQLIAADVDEKPLIAIVFTTVDNDLERLQAGRAMMALMIQAEIDGIASCALSQSVDLLAFRTRLRVLMSWDGYPQMMMRLGLRPAGPPAPLTRRRPVKRVLTFE